LLAQASQALADAAAWALAPTGALRRAVGAVGCRLEGEVPSVGLAASARVGPDLAISQVLAGRPW
jgi:hypothetical protein